MLYINIYIYIYILSIKQQSINLNSLQYSKFAWQFSLTKLTEGVICLTFQKRNVYKFLSSRSELVF